MQKIIERLFWKKEVKIDCRLVEIPPPPIEIDDYTRLSHITYFGDKIKRRSQSNWNMRTKVLVNTDLRNPVYQNSFYNVNNAHD